MPYTLSDADIKSLLALCAKLHSEGKAEKTKKVMEFLRSQVQIRKAKAELERLREQRKRVEETKRKIRERVDAFNRKKAEEAERERQVRLREVRGKTARRSIAKFVLQVLQARKETKRIKEAEQRAIAEAVARKAKEEEEARAKVSAPVSAGAGAPAVKLTPETTGQEAKKGEAIKYVYGGVQFLKEPQYLEKVLDVATGDFVKGVKVNPKYSMRKGKAWEKKTASEGRVYYRLEVTWNDITANASHPAYTTEVEEKKARYFASIKPKVPEKVVHQIKTTRDGKEIIRASWSYTPEGTFVFLAGKPFFTESHPIYRGNKEVGSRPAWVRHLQGYIRKLKQSISDDRAEQREAREEEEE